MSTITIIINTIGDAVSNNLTFTPSMINPDMKATTIYMPPTFKLSNSLIKEAVKDSTSVKDVLTTPSLFQALVRYSTDKAKGYKRITLQEAEESGIVESNFKFMQQLWLKKGQRIFIYDRAYDIITSTIKNITTPDSSQYLRFTMVVDLRVIQSRRNSLVNRTRMTCDDKKKRINQLYEDMYDVPFFADSNSSLKQSVAPVMYSSPGTGIATAHSPGKTKQPQQTNPFAPYGTRFYGLSPYGMMPAGFPVAYAVPQQQISTATSGGKNKKNGFTRRKQNREKKRSNTSKLRA